MASTGFGRFSRFDVHTRVFAWPAFAGELPPLPTSAERSGFSLCMTMPAGWSTKSFRISDLAWGELTLPARRIAEPCHQCGSSLHPF